jgi:hypothetical protein
VAGARGGRRIALLRSGLASKGTSLEERRARVYLAVLLDALDVPIAQRAAAALLLDSGDEKALRKIGDIRRRLRRGEYPPELVTRAGDDLRAHLGRGNNVWLRPWTEALDRAVKQRMAATNSRED